MRTFIDRYRRVILAIFGVLLMIAFMLPGNIRPGGDRANPVIGHIGKEAVHAAENALAEQDWEIVTRRVLYRDPAALDPRNAYVPLAAVVLRNPFATGPEDADQLVQMIAAHHQSYLLLLKEAEMRGTIVPQQTVDDFLNRPHIGIADQRLGRIIAFSDMEDLDLAERYRAAVGRLLMVQESFRTALTQVKISEPIRRQVLAENAQSLNLSLVTIPASQFPAPTPTPAQLEEQFKKYADVDPSEMEKSPYGYGYRFPNRVKLQTIEIPAAQVRAAAERERAKDDYGWDKDALRYYQAHQSEFPTTQPATAEASAARPTTRPFAEARVDARKAVLDADVVKLTRRIIDRITSTMASDYVAYRNAMNTGGADAKPPASSVGPAYNTYDYMQRLAAQVQQSFGTLPPTNSYDKDFLTQQAVAALPGVGTAMVNETREPVFRYVFLLTQAFSAEKDDTKTLSTFEPSPLCGDQTGNLYVFRVTDAQAAHAPASLQEVAAAVEADVRAAASFEQAKKVADDLVAKARQAGNLDSVAGEYKVQNLSGVRAGDPVTVAPLALSSPIAQRSFLRQTSDILGSTTKDNPRPIGLIQLPREGRAIVAQITGVQSLLTSPSELPLYESQASFIAMRMFAAPIAFDWFRYESIAARLNYTPTADNGDRNKPSTPANPAGGPAGQPLM